MKTSLLVATILIASLPVFFPRVTRGLKQPKKVYSIGVKHINEVHEDKHMDAILLDEHLVSNVISNFL